MAELILYKSPGKAIKLFLLIIPFVVLGIFLITMTPEKVVGWVGIIFFGVIGFGVGLFHLFDKRPQIIINANGIWDRTTNENKIKWEQIKDAYIVDIHGQKFISLVTDGSFIFKRNEAPLAKIIRKETDVQRLNLSLSQIKINVNSMHSFILKMAYVDKQEREKLLNEFPETDVK